MRLHARRLGLAALVLATATTLTLSGCSAGSSSSDAASGLPKLLQQAEKSGTLTIGSSVNAPIAYKKTGSSGLSGVTPDILRAYLKRKGLSGKIKLDVQTMDFASLIPALQSKRIDYIVDSMYVTPERKKVVTFTDTLLYNPEALVVRAGNPEHLTKLSQLCGKTAGSYEGTVYLDYLQSASTKCGSNPITIKTYAKIDDVMNDVKAGRLDAGLIDATVSSYALTQNASLGIALAKGYVPVDKKSTAASNAVLPGNQDFLKDFDKQLAAMKKDGTLARILEKNGLKPASVFLSS